MRTAATLIACLTLVACGSDDNGEDGGTAAPGPEGASLVVKVQPKGSQGPTRRTRIECERLGAGSERCRSLGDLTAKRLAPVPPDIACAEIYGGPARARVTGELRGERIAARFDRTDACEIKRWNDNSALLGPLG